MKKSAKARTRLRARQAEYDGMIKEDPRFKGAYHRAGSLKCK